MFPIKIFFLALGFAQLVSAISLSYTEVLPPTFTGNCGGVRNIALDSTTGDVYAACFTNGEVWKYTSGFSTPNVLSKTCPQAQQITFSAQGDLYAGCYTAANQPFIFKYIKNEGPTQFNLCPNNVRTTGLAVNAVTNTVYAGCSPNLYASPNGGNSTKKIVLSGICNVIQHIAINPLNGDVAGACWSDGKVMVWPNGTGGGYYLNASLPNAFGIAYGPNGDLYVSNADLDNVHVTGQTLRFPLTSRVASTYGSAVLLSANQNSTGYISLTFVPGIGLYGASAQADSVFYFPVSKTGIINSATLPILVDNDVNNVQDVDVTVDGSHVYSSDIVHGAIIDDQVSGCSSK